MNLFIGFAYIACIVCIAAEDTTPTDASSSDAPAENAPSTNAAAEGAEPTEVPAADSGDGSTPTFPDKDLEEAQEIFNNLIQCIRDELGPDVEFNLAGAIKGDYDKVHEPVLLKCLALKFDYMNEDGTFNVDKIKKYHKNNQLKEDTVDKCVEMVEEDITQRAVNLLYCLEGETPLENIPDDATEEAPAEKATTEEAPTGETVAEEAPTAEATTENTPAE